MTRAIAPSRIIYSSSFINKLSKPYTYRMDDSETWRSTDELSPKAQLTLVIKAYIESVFTSGISSIPKFDIKPNKTMVGVFRDKKSPLQSYDFEITPNGKISYIESEYKRNDSQQGDQCKVGKKCGTACVKKGFQCRRSLPLQLRRDLPGLQRAASAAKLGNWKLSAAAIAGLWVASKVLKFAKTVGEVAQVQERIKEIEAQPQTISEANLKRRTEEEEDKIKDQDYETLVAINPKNGEVLLNKDGKQTSVDPTIAEGMLLKGAIVTHNHPYLDSVDAIDSLGVSFSQPDVATACAAEVKEMRAVSAGYRHVIKPPKGGSWNREFYEATVEPSFRKHEKLVTQNLQSQIFSGKITVKQANSQYSHLLIEAVSKETGLQYSRERIPGIDAGQIATQRLATGKKP